MSINMLKIFFKLFSHYFCQHDEIIGLVLIIIGSENINECKSSIFFNVLTFILF